MTISGERNGRRGSRAGSIGLIELTMEQTSLEMLNSIKDE